MHGARHAQTPRPLAVDEQARDKEIVFKTKSVAERVGEEFMTDPRKAAKMDAAEVDENPVEA